MTTHQSIFRLILKRLPPSGTTCVPATLPRRCAKPPSAKPICTPSMTVADVGAGTGFIAAGLAPLVKHVHVLDGSAAMLDRSAPQPGPIRQCGIP